MSGKPTPGSDEAAAIGCRCARMDNGYGHHPYMGWNEDGTGNWSIRGDCPIHGFSHDLDIDGRYPTATDEVSP